MRVIHKKISLEPYKSRINGTLKSYNQLDNALYNYNALPYNVNYNGTVLSYPTLKDRYYFCKEYKNLLKYDNCSTDSASYKNILEYYKKEYDFKTLDSKNYFEELHNLYESYGGDKFYEWCKKILFEKYNNNDNDFRNLYKTSRRTANLTIQILFTTNIDDLGEFSIFSKDWEEGEDYRSSSNIYNGATVIYNDEVWSLKSGITTSDYGSIFSTKYDEFYFPNISQLPYDINHKWYEDSKKNGNIKYTENQWENKTDIFFKKNKETEKLKYKYYSIKNGKVVYTDEQNGLINKMCDTHNIINNNSNGFYLINNTLYNVKKYEYIKIDKYNIVVYTVDNPYVNMKYYSYKRKKTLF